MVSEVAIKGFPVLKGLKSIKFNTGTLRDLLLSLRQQIIPFTSTFIYTICKNYEHVFAMSRAYKLVRNQQLIPINNPRPDIYH